MILRHLGLFNLEGKCFCDTGIESPKASEVLQKALPPGGPRVPVYVGARDIAAISRPNQTAFPPDILWHGAELLENSLYVLSLLTAFTE